MSWYVKQLLRDSYKIRKRIGIVNARPVYGNTKESFFFVDEDIPVGYTKVLTQNENGFDDDTYSDLLSLEIAIKRLRENGNISDLEMKMINLLYEGASFNYISKSLSITNPTMRKFFKRLCEKLAFYLGDYFTDDGYIDYIQRKYNLDDKEIEAVTKIIKGNNK